MMVTISAIYILHGFFDWKPPVDNLACTNDRVDDDGRHASRHLGRFVEYALV